MTTLIDWARLAQEPGLDRFSGTAVARAALERLLGPASVEAAVQCVLHEEAGWNVAQSVLVYLVSEQATRLAYRAYQEGGDAVAAPAVRLIKDIAHPAAKAWIAEFLSDPRLGSMGMDVLDQLVFAHAVDPQDAELQALLALGRQHPLEDVREKAAAIADFVADAPA